MAATNKRAAATKAVAKKTVATKAVAKQAIAKQAVAKQAVAKQAVATKAASSTKPAEPVGDPLLAQVWANPDDQELLRVWADSLSERGDLRGEYIQLALLPDRTPAQTARMLSLDRQHHGKLAGPAREYLREFELGPDGLVHAARCEVDKLADGLPVIEWLNPRLALKVTSLKHKDAISALSKMSLERIYHVSFIWGVIGSQGGTPMTDKQLIQLAPAFRRVRHLSLDCGGYLDNCFTPEGLRVLGETVEALEYLCITYYNTRATQYGDQKRKPLPPMEDYAQVIATAPGFRTLKAVFLRANDTGRVAPEVFSGLPALVYAETSPKSSEHGWRSTYYHPTLAVEIEAAKRGVRTLG